MKKSATRPNCSYTMLPLVILGIEDLPVLVCEKCGSRLVLEDRFWTHVPGKVVAPETVTDLEGRYGFKPAPIEP